MISEYGMLPDVFCAAGCLAAGSCASTFPVAAENTAPAIPSPASCNISRRVALLVFMNHLGFRLVYSVLRRSQKFHRRGREWISRRLGPGSAVNCRSGFSRESRNASNFPQTTHSRLDGLAAPL